MKRIGFAGLGRMGQHMVRNLVKARFDVCVWNRSADKSDAIAKELGICSVKHPCNLTEQCEIIITMLSDDDASMAVHTGENGLFTTVGAKYFVEMGTMSPSHINDLVNAAGERIIIDAPVSGATNAAKNAQLMVMLGSDKTNAEPIIPALNSMSRKLVFLGASGAGATMKLSVNMLIHGINQTVSEALTLAEASGIDLEDAYDAIEESAAVSPMLRFRRPIYLDEQSQEVTFALSLARKDMGLALALSEQYNVPMPQSQTTFDVLKRAETKGFGERDMASIINFMRGEST